MAVSTRQRRESILAEAYRLKHVTVKDLSQRFDVSPATVRRDLKSLAEEGYVELEYGGASVLKNSDHSFRSKLLRNLEAKQTIGRLAADLIEDGEQIFLDSGTTCFQMVPQVRRKKSLCVIVNSIRIAEELDAPGLDVILLGGQYRPDRMDAVGPLAETSLDHLRGYRAFIGTDGLEMNFGLTANDIESANLYGLAVRNSREAILLADHSKFAAPSLYKIVDWDSVSTLVTDGPPSAQWAEFLESKDISLIYPPSQKDKQQD